MGQDASPTSRVWEVVLEQFRAMGASRLEMHDASRRLREDADFHHEWAESLPDWCPSLAVYTWGG